MKVKDLFKCLGLPDEKLKMLTAETVIGMMAKDGNVKEGLNI